MRLFICAAAFTAILAGQSSTSGNVSTTGNVAFTNTSVPNFNTTSMTFAQFDISNLAGLPCVLSTGAYSGRVVPNCITGDYPSFGYQGADYVNGNVIWISWVISQTLQFSVSLDNAVLVGYKTGGGSGGHSSPFANPANWWKYDMNANVPGCPNVSGGTQQPCPGGDNSDVVVGNNIYLVPGSQSHQPMFSLCVMGSSGITSCSHVAVSTVLTSYAGNWATGIYDGSKYLYYIPSSGGHTWVRHDTSYDTGGVISSNAASWKSFNSAGCSGNPTGSWLGSTWDGHRYIYALPDVTVSPNTLLGILDTSIVSSFGCGNFTYYNLANLGGANQPALTGNVSASLLAGMATGAVVTVGNPSTSAIAILCIAPWETYKPPSSGFTGYQVAGYITVSVQVGTYTSGIFYPQGQPSGPPSITSSSATWNGYNLTNLYSNPQWATNGWATSPGNYFPGPNLNGPTLSAFQGVYVNSTTGNITFIPSDGQFWYSFNPSFAIDDPRGKYLQVVTSVYGDQEYYAGWIGGPTACAYPSPATSQWLTQNCGLP